MDGGGGPERGIGRRWGLYHPYTNAYRITSRGITLCILTTYWLKQQYIYLTFVYMLTEQEFVATIRRATGRQIGDNCGFIMGTMHPYVYHGIDTRSAGEGYIVWRRNPNTGETQELHIKQPEADKQLQLIIDFFNAP